MTFELKDSNVNFKFGKLNLLSFENQTTFAMFFVICCLNEKTLSLFGGNF